MIELLPAEKISQVAFGYDQAVILLLFSGLCVANQADRSRAAEGIKPVFQRTDACLHGVLIDDFAERSVCYGEHILLNTHGFQGPGQKVLPCNVEFFHRGIAGEVDDLHTV